MTESTRENPSLRLWQTAFSLSLLQLAMHVAAALVSRDPRVLMPHVVAWIHDLALLCAVAWIFAWLARAPLAALRSSATACGRLTIVLLGMLLAVYPRILAEFLASPVNFLETDWGTVKVFVEDYLGLRSLWPAALALGAGAFAPRAHFLNLGRRWALAGIPLAVFAVFALGRDSPNPVVFSLQDSARQVFVPRAVPRIQTETAGTSALVPASTVDWRTAGRAARYDHVMIVVLEGVTSAEFEAVFMARADGFFARHRGRARYFSRYYATNLDSYTSLLAMTASVQVPFRAYAAPERYAPVNGAPNIARGLRAAGFRTLFISTFEHQPFVPHPGDWDRVMDRGDLGDLSGWVSLGSSRMEAATEDRAALPTILDFVKSTPRSLVLWELVYGHSPEWRSRTGLRPIDYYDRLLADLWERLALARSAARTLLVVVSDHGVRSRAAAADNYRVPLLIVGETVEPGEDLEFRSHLDLQSLVAHFLSNAGMPKPRREMFTVGSTERWIYGRIRADGGHVFIDDRTGRALTGTLDPMEAHESFQAGVASFSGAFGPAAR